MYILEELWRGEISPNEKFMGENGTYRKQLKQLSEVRKKLSSALDDDGQAYLKEYEQIQVDLASIENREMFIEAFRLGAKIILDVVSEHQGESIYAVEK